MNSGDRYSFVFDTSTLVSAALLPKSIPDLALKLAFLTGSLCVSEETLLELESVLAREHFDRYRSPELRDKFFSFLFRSGKNGINRRTCDWLS